MANKAEPLKANSESPATAVPISIAASLIAENALPADTVAVAEPLPLPTQTSGSSSPEQPAPSDTPVDVVENNVTLPNRAQTSSEAQDPLLALLDDTEQQRLNAAESIKNSLVQFESEAAAKARTDRIIASRAKQQQRTETRLARANAAAQQAGNVHRVEAGDTLFNISQRYNLSVADLITVNNIKGNSIRKGQVLKVTAASVQRNAVRNVSYTVRKGDTLNTIASRFNVDINDIRRWNRNTRTVTPGQRLKLMGS